jgi:glycosyltransferase involved in cell wall biosynthesis
MARVNISSNMRRPIVLCFVAYYLPGFRSGGPVRTIANLVDRLGDQLDFRIVTRDRDALARAPYTNIKPDTWNDVGQAHVFYLSPSNLNVSSIARLMRNTDYDVLYLNSFFAFSYTTLPLLARRFGFAPPTPCIIAPRGEFSAGALALKPFKKAVYRGLAAALRLFDGLTWQASSPYEADDIRRAMGGLAGRIVVAPDLPTPSSCSRRELPDDDAVRGDAPLQLIFLSRISPMKNLDFLLQVLGDVRATVQLQIYGPLRELSYWQHCQRLMAKLPSHVRADYEGEVRPSQVVDVFSRADLFVLPTRGENYGHVVLESLTAGTPVLLSDQTPWQASSDLALQVLPLGDRRPWAAAIDALAGLGVSMRQQRRQAALAYAEAVMAAEESTAQNLYLFHSLCGKV